MDAPDAPRKAPGTYTWDDLAAFERELLLLQAQGLTNKEIAAAVGKGESSINQRLSRGKHNLAIYRKIGTESQRDTVAWVLRNAPAELLISRGITLPPSDPSTVLSPEPGDELNVPIPFSQAEERIPLKLQQEIDGTLPNHLLASSGFVALSVLYGCALLFIFVPIYFLKCRECEANYWASFYMFIPFLGGVIGGSRLISTGRLFEGRTRTALAIYSFGLIGWALGNAVWLFFVLVLDIFLPYPSVGDLGYFTGNIFWVLAVSILAGRFLTLPVSAVLMRCLPVVCGVALATAIVLVNLTNWDAATLLETSLKIGLNIIYPTADIAMVCLLFLMVRSPLFNQAVLPTRWAVKSLLLGAIMLFLADLSFSITISLPQDHMFAFYNGSPSDLLFCSAFYIMSTGVVLMPLEM
jgi:DNA-binding CsgD family transcriptional regulator